MPTDPAATVWVPATTAQRVLEKNVPTAMAFPVMDSHGRNAVNVPLLVVVIVQPMVTAHHAQTAPTDLAMQTVASVENVLRMAIVRSEESVLPMVTAQTGENALVTVIEMVLLVEIAHVMETVMVHHVAIVPTVLPVIALHMVTEETVTHVQSAVVSVEAVQVELLVANDLVAIVEGSPHSVIATTGLNVPSVPVMVIVPNGVIVLSAANAPHMATAVLVQNVGETDQTTETVKNVPVLVIVVVVQTVLVLHVVVEMTALHVGKSQSSLKSSAWHANYGWFVRITMTHGSMTMSPVMSSIRSLVMS